MLHQFYELALQTIRNQIEQYLFRMETGAIHNFEEFKEISGKIYGLRQAEEILKEIFDQFQKPNRMTEPLND